MKHFQIQKLSMSFYKPLENYFLTTRLFKVLQLGFVGP